MRKHIAVMNTSLTRTEMHGATLVSFIRRTASPFTSQPHHALWGLVTVVMLLLAACSSGNPAESSSTPTTLANSTENSLSIVLLAHDIEVDDVRVPIVVMRSDAAQTRINDRLSDLSFSYRHVDDETFSPLGGIEWRQWPVSGGAYTAVPDFDRPGIWEFQVSLNEGGKIRTGTTFLQVEQESSASGVGDTAPVTVTKTAATVDEVRQISSAFNPDPGFYSLSLDEALSNGRPTIILFSTPAFCATQTCGPQLETLGDLKELHSDDIDFIHVEIFDNIREMLDTGDSSISEISQPVEDWGLVTEPWTFFVNANGVIVARFEQFANFEELSEATGLLSAAN